ncbi:glycosyltransferase family 4 protein [Patescibacteria group bacterium]|nr:glycosyltransferase family 4 protein [Patescibacteria group bacterium]
MNVLTISLDKCLFDPTSDVFRRHQFYASALSGLTVIVFTLEKENKRAVSRRNLKIIPTNSTNKFSYVLDTLKIVRDIDTKFDLISAQDPFATGVAGILVKRFLKYPLNIQIHSEFFNSRYFREESLFNRFLYYLGLLVLTQADSVRARNNHIRDDIKRRYPGLKNKIGYVGVRINEEFLRPVKKAKRQKDLIVTVGRIAKQKNFPSLVEAVNIARKQIPNIELWIVGDGEERKNIGDGANVLGWKKPDEIKKIVEKASLFALSSNHEGWALVCLEALARGTPVIMTNTGCAGEIVIQNKTGYVVPVGNVKKMAEGIVEILRHPQKYQKMALAGRKLVLIDGELEKIKKDMLSMYKLTIHDTNYN